jgi:hypothetical protein
MGSHIEVKKKKWLPCFQVHQQIIHAKDVHIFTVFRLSILKVGTNEKIRRVGKLETEICCVFFKMAANFES